MEKKLNIILILLGLSAFIVGMFGMLNRNNDLLPLAGILFLITGILFIIILYTKKKDNNKK